MVPLTTKATTSCQPPLPSRHPLEQALGVRGDEPNTSNPRYAEQSFLHPHVRWWPQARLLRSWQQGSKVSELWVGKDTSFQRVTRVRRGRYFRKAILCWWQHEQVFFPRAGWGDGEYRRVQQVYGMDQHRTNGIVRAGAVGRKQ